MNRRHLAAVGRELRAANGQPGLIEGYASVYGVASAVSGSTMPNSMAGHLGSKVVQDIVADEDRIVTPYRPIGELAGRIPKSKVEKT